MSSLHEMVAGDLSNRYRMTFWLAKPGQRGYDEWIGSINGQRLPILEVMVLLNVTQE